MNLTATHINYFFTCKRRLWLFSRKITCEQGSEFLKNRIEMKLSALHFIPYGVSFKLAMQDNALMPSA